MTIIAYKDGFLAAESRITLYGEKDKGTCCFDRSPKLFRKFAGTPRECIIGTAGESDPGNKFIAWYGERKSKKCPEMKGAHLLVLDSSGLWEWDGSDTPDQVLDDYYAVGCATKIALGALFIPGVTAEQAVHACIAHDPYCGGKVIAWKLGDGQVISWK
jgi:hypothetical protein